METPGYNPLSVELTDEERNLLTQAREWVESAVSRHAQKRAFTTTVLADTIQSARDAVERAAKAGLHVGEYQSLLNQLGAV